MKTTKSLGDAGEDKACRYLLDHGYDVMERNWRTRYCEIDIVARKQSRIYFVEVKTRSSDAFGSGLEHVTPKKIKQMSFAAELWVQHHGWKGDYQLAALSVVDERIEFIEDLM